MCKKEVKQCTSFQIWICECPKNGNSFSDRVVLRTLNPGANRELDRVAERATLSHKDYDIPYRWLFSDFWRLHILDSFLFICSNIDLTQGFSNMEAMDVLMQRLEKLAKKIMSTQVVEDSRESGKGSRKKLKSRKKKSGSKESLEDLDAKDIDLGLAEEDEALALLGRE